VMLIAVLALVGALAAIAAFLFAVVVVGIRQEPSDQELSSRASGPVAVLVRRLLGVHVRRPADANANDDREACLAGHSAERWNTDGEGR
jgi:hypothetical protein